MRVMLTQDPSAILLDMAVGEYLYHVLIYVGYTALEDPLVLVLVHMYYVLAG